MKILFVCNYGQNRSRTAAEIFGHDFETQAVGIYKNVVTEKQVQWADAIIVMEEEQREILKERFSAIIKNKKLLCMNLLNAYSFMHPELIKILKLKMKKLREEMKLPIK